MTGTEKSDRSGGPSCEARTDRYVILNGGGWVSNAKVVLHLHDDGTVTWTWETS